jgi:acetyl esterase
MNYQKEPILELTTQAFADSTRNAWQTLYTLPYSEADASVSQRSYEEFANGPWLTRAAMVWFWDAYAPNKEDRKKTTASPLSATTEQLKGLPPALIITDENDVLRDEGEAYARKLIQAGVDVTAVRMLATHHDFAMLNALAGTPAAKAAIQLASEKLTIAFNG